MQLKAVLFDVGGTLETFRFTTELRLQNTRHFRACLQRAGVRLDMDDEQLCERITTRIAAYQKWNRQSLVEIPSDQIWLRYVFNDMGLDENALASVWEELSFIHETRYFLREMRPEIPSVLTQIQTMGLSMGVISNTHSLTQVPYTLKQYGIDAFFSPVVLSSVFGSRKPDPSIFYHAARLAGLPTGSMIYVGDKINRDILGAKRSGFRLAVKIQHPYDDGDADLGATPDAVINDMRELVPILQNLMRQDGEVHTQASKCKIKGVFFDAGNILYQKPRKGVHMKRFLARHKLRAVADVRQGKRKLKDQAFHGVIDRHAFYEGVVRLYGVSDPGILAEGVNAMLLDATTVEIVEGVPETLRALKEKGFILGIISDTATPIQVKLGWFEQAGFGDVFDTFISSKEIGTRKPETLIYQEAFCKVGLTQEEAVFVGHKASELSGARKAGMATIAFNYDKNARADVYIQHFADLLKLKLLND